MSAPSQKIDSASVQVTQPMIDAGVRELNAHTSDEFRVLPDEEIVEAIFLAMLKCESQQVCREAPSSGSPEFDAWLELELARQRAIPMPLVEAWAVAHLSSEDALEATRQEFSRQVDSGQSARCALCGLRKRQQKGRVYPRAQKG